MGDTQGVSTLPDLGDLACYSEDPLFSDTSVDNSLQVTTSVCTPEPQICEAPDPTKSFDYYAASNPSVLKDINLQAPVCRGEFSNSEDYTRLLKQGQREAKLGATLANMPVSPEEGIKPDPKVVIYAGEAYPLAEVWTGLPEQVRVYLSTVKDIPGLGIAYELEDKTKGIPARWHVFEMSKATPVASPPPAAVPAEKPDPKKNNKKQQAPLGIAVAGTAMMGATILMRSPESSPAANTPGSQGSRPISTPPNGEPAVNINVGSAIAGTAIVIGVSLGLRKLFPDLKSEPQFFLNLASMYGINYVMYRTGFFPNYNWKTFTGQIPGMFSMGFLGGILVDGVGRATGNKNFQFGSFGHELATMGLTLGAFYTIATSEKLLPLLSGGTRTVSGLSFAAPAGGAGVLGGIGQGLKVAGYFGIANLAIGAGKWIYYHASGNSGTPEGRLEDFISDIVRQKTSTDSFLGKRVGALWDGFIGHIQDGLVSGLCLFSDDATKGREMERQQIRDEMVNGSKEFGKSVRTAVAQLVARNIKMDTGQVDWYEVEKGIREMYGQNPGGISNVYKLIGYTGHIATEAKEIKDSIDVDGTITNRAALEQIAKTELKKLHGRSEKRQLALLQSIGAIKIVGNQTFFTPPENLNDEQKTRMENEVAPVVLEAHFYGEALKRLEPAGN